MKRFTILLLLHFFFFCSYSQVPPPCDPLVNGITYNSPFCTTLSTPQAVQFIDQIDPLSSFNGDFTATPTGLNINSTTGAIIPSLSLPGNYVVRFTSNGCGFFTTNVTINAGSFTAITPVASCNSYTWNGQTFTSSGNYTYSVGCNAQILNLTIKNSTQLNTQITSCNNYTWNGLTYTASGSYTRIITNSVGCDSVMYLGLTINSGTSTTTTNSACNSYTWPANGQTYTVSGTYTHTYNNANGCASANFLNLTVIPSTSTTTTVSACDSYTWPVNGQTYSTTANYTSVVNCNTQILNLTIKNSTQSNTQITSCNNYTWNGTMYNSSGLYTYVTRNYLGCDSFAYLHLTINKSTYNSSSANSCNKYYWNGTNYTSSGTYTHTYTNSNGCLSVDTLYLTINNTGLCDTNLVSYKFPTGISYQAVARDSLGQVLANTNLMVRFSLRDSSINGNIVYAETQSLITNRLGLFTAVIGNGNAQTNTYNSINWMGQQKFLQVEIDKGNGYQLIGVQQLLSVPYANAAKQASSIKNPNLPVYLNNAAALQGGLQAGDTYRTPTGDLKVVYTGEIQ